ncbi:MAG TPA: 2-dehydropantoate 2-reductase [Candidatus Limnocylindrales bacterium]|nr:2-dehydropantoate 2-reductase [Candidatus Limnocylindrales bacterium]
MAIEPAEAIERDPGPADPLRVVVVGAGAVGSFLGGMLASSGAAVTLLLRRPRDAGDPGSLRLEEPEGAREVPVARVTDRAAVDGADLVIVAVKAFDLEEALETAGRWPGAPVLTVQNGVGAEAVADAWIPFPTPLLAASLTTALEPVAGGVRRRRTGGIGIAVVRDDDEGRGASLRDRLATAWTAAGLPATVCPDADAMKWSKLLANLVGNATSAILDMDPGAIYADRRTYPIERRQLQEALAVMRALGLRPVSLPGADVSMLLRGIALPDVLGRPLVARGIAGARGGKSPSLRLDVRAGGGGPTEVRWLNGAVAAAAASTGVPTPVNEALAGLVEEVAADPDRAAFFKGEPGRLADAIAAWSSGT